MRQLFPFLSSPFPSPARVSPFLSPKKCKNSNFSTGVESFVAGTVKKNNNTIPFGGVCLCSAPPVLEYSARVFWVVFQIPAHPGTS